MTEDRLRKRQILMQLQRILSQSVGIYEEEDRSEGLHFLVWVRDTARGLLVDPDLKDVGENLLYHLAEWFESKHGPLPVFAPVPDLARRSENPRPPGLEDSNLDDWARSGVLDGFHFAHLVGWFDVLVNQFGRSLSDAYEWLADRKFLSYQTGRVVAANVPWEKFFATVRPFYEEFFPQPDGTEPLDTRLRPTIAPSAFGIGNLAQVFDPAALTREAINKTDPSEGSSQQYPDPHQWSRALAETGTQVPPSLPFLLSSLMEEGDRNLQDTLTWMLEQRLLRVEFSAFRLDETAANRLAESTHNERRETQSPDTGRRPQDDAGLRRTVTGSDSRHPSNRDQHSDSHSLGAVPAPGHAKVVVVMTAGAGSGKTMTATNLAVLLAQSNDAPRVCVVDADLQFGDVCYSLGLEPEFTVVEAVHQLEHLDGASLESILTHHPAGFEVLAAPLEPAFADEVSAAAMEEIINKLGEMFDYVMVDTASLRDETLMSILNLAHQVLLIVNVDHLGLPGVKNAKHVLEHMLREKFPVSKMQLVLNSRTRRVAIDKEEIERSLKLKIAAIIPSDRAVPASIKEGRPVVEFAPESRAAKALKTVCDLVVG